MAEKLAKKLEIESKSFGTLFRNKIRKEIPSVDCFDSATSSKEGIISDKCQHSVLQEKQFRPRDSDN